MKSFLLPLLLLPALAFGQARDSAFAVHKLFIQKRRSADGYASASRDAASPARYEARQAQGLTPPTAQDRRQDALAATATGAAGLLQAGRYSPEREADILRRYAQGQPLPPDIRRRLRRKHFHRTAQEVRAGR